MMSRMRLVLVLLVTLAFSSSDVQAQENLFSDPGFEGTYTGRSRPDFNIPRAWDAWFTESPRTESWMNIEPLAFPHTAGFKREGGKSLHVARGSGTFTAAVYQIVNDIPEGATLRASAWAYIENVSEARSRVRIGIGNNVARNPFASDIVWSPWRSTPQAWNNVTVTATVEDGGQVTVFIYMTQDWPNDPNGIYIDEASLTFSDAEGAPSTSEGGQVEDTEEEGGGTVVEPPRNLADFVTAQNAREDGSVVHTVQPGDTIAAIAVAYDVSSARILELNDIEDPGLISVGQELLIKPPPDEAAAATPEVTAETTTEAVSVVATPLPEDDSSEPPTPTAPTATPTETTPTVPPATPTEAPTAPVVSVASANVHPAADPAALASSVCMLMFEDSNTDRIQEEGEPLLAGGTLALMSGDEELESTETDGVSEPHCFADLAAGEYVAVAQAPEGYGLTTPDRYRLRVQPGTRVDVSFGAATGVEAVEPPAAQEGDQSAPETGGDDPLAQETDGAATPVEQLFEISGLLAFGLAAVVLVGGIGVSLALRRRQG